MTTVRRATAMEAEASVADGVLRLSGGESAPARSALSRALVLAGAVGVLAGSLTLFAAAYPAAAAGTAPTAANAATTTIPDELNAADLARYQKIFDLQAQARWKDADVEIAKVSNKILLGHVQFQRFMHPTAYKATYDELKNWLQLYADHPDADRVYAVALARKPKGAANPRAPVKPYINGAAHASPLQAAVPAQSVPPTYRSTKLRSTSDTTKVKSALTYVRNQLKAGSVDAAYDNLIHSVTITTLADDTERDMLAGEIAAGYFYAGRDAQALKLAEQATRARKYMPESDWIAGLAAWNLGQLETARGHFEQAGKTTTLDARTRAGAAFWAARANLATRHPETVVGWLEKAASEPTTMYGILAARQLGRPGVFGWELPHPSPSDAEQVLGIPAIHRAIALAQVGEDYYADREIRNVYETAGFAVALPLLALTAEHEMAAAELRIGRDLLTYTGQTFTGALYPVPSWAVPVQGFQVDQALLLAVARQESGFNSRAVSVSGAHGLMQFLPSTASFVANDASLKRTNRNRLYEADYSLDLGQKYLTMLMQSFDIKGSLFHTLAAYNGGPGNVNKWSKAMGPVSDPLIFIERIPARETRDFVARVTANLWIYRERLGQPSTSLDALAAGQWPVYESVNALPQVANGNGRN